MHARIIGYLALISFIGIFAVSCGGSGGGNDKRDFSEDLQKLIPTQAQCAEPYTENKFIYDTMHTIYYWADSAPVLNYTQYTDLRSLLEDMIVPIDVYSNVFTASEYASIILHRNIGTGVAFAISGNRLFVNAVAVNSPAANTILKKGYEIFSINGVQASSITDSETLSNALGANEEGVHVVINYADYDGVNGSVTIVKTEYTAGDIEQTKIFTDTNTGRKTGYFLYHSFDKLDNELKNTVAFFDEADINDLVIDLRRNPGGSLDTAIYLINSFLGTHNLGEQIVRLKYNDSYPTVAYLSQDLGYRLDPDKIVFIVSDSSASASEALINALKPYKDVYVIGTTTYGKPVGSHPMVFCGNYLLPITFEVTNSKNEGGYFNGINPDCYREENYAAMRDFGDPEEQMLKAAMTYLQTSTCENTGSPFSAAAAIKTKPSYKEILVRNGFK